MIRVIHGDDEFAISNVLRRYLEAVAPPDLREPNLTIFEAPNVALGEVMAASRVMPFLTDRRAVVVKGMLQPMETRGARTRKDWEDFGKVIATEGIEITNELIFVEHVPLRLANPSLKPLAAISDVELHNKPKRNEMMSWLQSRFRAHGARASASAIQRLNYLGGDDTRRLDSEIEKLALYADGKTIEPADIDLMVSDARQEGIFRVMDAIIDGNPKLALSGFHNLMLHGESIEGIFSLLSRQLRILIIASYLLSNRTNRAEIGNRLNITMPWLLDKTCRQASNTGLATLQNMQRQLLEVDVQVKTGQIERNLAIEVLIARIANRNTRR